jgi:hypothetical protein
MSAASQSLSSRHTFSVFSFSKYERSEPRIFSEFSQNFLRGFCVKKERAGKEKNRGEE